MHGAILLLLLHQAGVAPLDDVTEPIDCYFDVPCEFVCVVVNTPRAGWRATLPANQTVAIDRQSMRATLPANESREVSR